MSFSFLFFLAWALHTHLVTPFRFRVYIPLRGKSLFICFADVESLLVLVWEEEVEEVGSVGEEEEEDSHTHDAASGFMKATPGIDGIEGGGMSTGSDKRRTSRRTPSRLEEGRGRKKRAGRGERNHGPNVMSGLVRRQRSKAREWEVRGYVASGSSSAVSSFVCCFV